MNVARSTAFFAFLFVISLVYGQPPKSGLSFCAHNHNIDERTSLILNNNESYRLGERDNFSIELDMFLRDEAINFGYIFRIISNKDENFDFIINQDLDVFLVINNHDFQLKSILLPKQWNQLTISFQKKQNNISLRFNDEIINCPYDLTGLESLWVNFGQCDRQNFLTNDVAPVILKDIRIYYDAKEVHRWMLDKHGENIVYDQLKNRPAIAHNPHWIMDNRISWKKIAEFQSTLFPQVTFDPGQNNIYILNPGELITYSLLTHSEQRTECSPEIRGKYYNHLLFDPVSSRLLFYHLETNQNYFYDFDNHVWKDYQNDEKEPAHAHHNRYISGKDFSLYLFGGYGFYKYNSDFFKINLKTNERATYDFSHTITPRYLAAMGGNAAGDKIYILGGRGAELGRQELSPKNFSDLFEVDLQTLKVKYLFDINKEGERENIYSNSLVVDEESKNIYVLAYPNKKYTSSVSLKRINLETQTDETLADSIEFYFQDITSYCDLYYSPQLSQLIAITAYSKDQLASTIQVHTLDYPPLIESDVIQNEVYPSGAQWILILSCILLFLLVAFIGIKIRKKKHSNISKSIQKETVSTEEIREEKHFYNIKEKSILFLGGFQVFDKNGKNITGDFTPTLKYILVLLILYTAKNNKGISSSKLQELLWFDKTDEAARNNRSVNLSKLRALLDELGKVDITSENIYWTISFPDDVFSDYTEVLRLVSKIKNRDITSEEDLLRLLELLDQGVLLPNIQLEWVDNFKTDFSNHLIDTLMQIINNPKNSFSENLEIHLRIADSLLKIDSINEEAIKIKCQTLVKMGKMGLAKTTFDNFNKEYQLLLGEPYSGSYNLLPSGKN
jgi:DNA-binding SARP family transcriptional activator